MKKYSKYNNKKAQVWILFGLSIVCLAFLLNVPVIQENNNNTNVEEEKIENETDDFNILLASNTINPMNSEYYGQGTSFSAFAIYDTSEIAANPFIDADTSRTVELGDPTPSSFDYTKISSSNNDGDNIAANYDSGYTSDQSLTSMSHWAGSGGHINEYGPAGSYTVNEAIGSYSDDDKVILKVDKAAWYGMDYYSFANPHTGGGVLGIRAPTRVTQFRVRTYQNAGSWSGSEYVEDVEVRLRIYYNSNHYYTDWKTLTTNCPEAKTAYNADYSDATLLDYINKGGYVDSVEYQMYDSHDGIFGDTDVWRIHYIQLTYYYDWDFDSVVNYETPVINNTDNIAAYLQEIEMTVEVDNCFGDTIVQTYDPSSGWVNEQTYNDDWDGFLWTKTVTSGFTDYIDGSGEIGIRLSSSYNDLNTVNMFNDLNLNIDMIRIDLIFENTTDSNYTYYYNMTSPNPKYQQTFSISTIEGLKPKNVTIDKEELYSLDKIYDQNGVDCTSNPNKQNGQKGDTDLIMTGFSSQWSTLGTWEIIYESNNILDLSNFNKTKSMGLNYYEYM
ncbi:MAG: hypothetical protein GF364_05115, partial [Candidatus Lokiarchaeota archaeon]|nr:hypothetical protein [Candidatus Lokiarchaeota archaeon]